MPKSGRPDVGRGESAPEPQHQPIATDPEAQRQAEAQVMLAALRRDIPDVFDR